MGKGPGKGVLCLVGLDCSCRNEGGFLLLLCLCLTRRGRGGRYVTVI